MATASLLILLLDPAPRQGEVEAGRLDPPLLPLRGRRRVPGQGAREAGAPAARQGLQRRGGRRSPGHRGGLS